MTEYLLTLIGMSALISVVGMIAPQKSKKYTRLICALCLLCVILRPLPSILDTELFSVLDIESEETDSSESFYAEIYNNVIRDASAEKISNGLEDMMIKDLELPRGEFEVNVDIDDSNGNIVVKRTTVMLRDGAVSRDPHAIVSYLEEMLGCKCEIIYT